MIAIEILRVIEQNPRVTPLEISHKLKISTQYVRNTVRILTELGLVETPVRGVYVVTDLGKYVLNKQARELTHLNQQPPYGLKSLKRKEK